MTATFIFAIVYWFQEDSSQATESSNVPEEAIQTYIEEQELKLVPQVEYTELVNQNQKLTDRLNELQKEDSLTDESASSNDQGTVDYILEIEQGMNSSDIAELLEKNEVIVGTEPLIDYLAEHDLSQTIQLGSYEVDSTMSIEEIAHLIITLMPLEELLNCI